MEFNNSSSILFIASHSISIYFSKGKTIIIFFKYYISKMCVTKDKMLIFIIVLNIFLFLGA